MRSLLRAGMFSCCWKAFRLPCPSVNKITSLSFDHKGRICSWSSCRTSCSPCGAIKGKRYTCIPLSILIRRQSLCVMVEPRRRQIHPPTAAQAVALVSCLSFPLEPTTLSDFMRQQTEDRKRLFEGVSGSRQHLQRTPSESFSSP